MHILRFGQILDLGMRNYPCYGPRDLGKGCCLSLLNQGLMFHLEASAIAQD